MSSEELMKLYNVLNDEGISSHIDLKDNYDTKIKPILESDDFKKLLKHDVKEFLDILFNNEPYIYNKKIILEHMVKYEHNPNTLYMLSLFSEKDKAYRNLPLLLKGLIEKLDIEKYKYCTMEDIVSRVYGILDMKTTYYDREKNHLISEIDHKIYNTKYQKYEDAHAQGKFNENDVEDLSVWAERRVFIREKERFKDKENEGTSIWVAHDFGDGYCFDVLTIDKVNKIESLIEVKSGKEKYFTLTENELNVMRNCQFKNAEYLVYKYTPLTIGGFTIDTIDTYLYSPQLDMMLDNYGNQYEIVLSGYKSTDLYNVDHPKYTIKKIEKEKQKTIF